MYIAVFLLGILVLYFTVGRTLIEEDKRWREFNKKKRE